MKYRSPSIAGVSPVIAVILMVAITVVLAGVVFVWAMSFTGNQSSAPGTINIRIEDAVDLASNNLVDPPGFLTTDKMISISLEGKSQVLDWNELMVKAQKSNENFKKELIVLELEDAPFDAATNHLMEPGQTATLGPSVDNEFQSGNTIDIYVYENDELVFRVNSLIIH